jgi:hypothetical protein
MPASQHWLRHCEPPCRPCTPRPASSPTVIPTTVGPHRSPASIAVHLLSAPCSPIPATAISVSGFRAIQSPSPTTYTRRPSSIQALHCRQQSSGLLPSLLAAHRRHSVPSQRFVHCLLQPLSSFHHTRLQPCSSTSLDRTVPRAGQVWFADLITAQVGSFSFLCFGPSRPF